MSYYQIPHHFLTAKSHVRSSQKIRYSYCRVLLRTTSTPLTFPPSKSVLTPIFKTSRRAQLPSSTSIHSSPQAPRPSIDTNSRPDTRTCVLITWKRGVIESGATHDFGEIDSRIFVCCVCIHGGYVCLMIGQGVF